MVELEDAKTAEKLVKLMMSCCPGDCRRTSLHKRTAEQKITGVDEEIVVVAVNSRFGRRRDDSGGWECDGGSPPRPGERARAHPRHPHGLAATCAWQPLLIRWRTALLPAGFAGWPDGLIHFYFANDDDRHVCLLQLVHPDFMRTRQEITGGTYGQLEDTHTVDWAIAEQIAAELPALETLQLGGHEGDRALEGEEEEEGAG